MNSLSTFIRYYLLVGIFLLMPISSTVYKSTEALNTVQVKPPALNTQPMSAEYTDNEFEVATVEMNTYLFNTEQDDNSVVRGADFWTTLHSIESKQGRLLYRPSNKKRNCDTTSSPCGHHQLSLQALVDIKCSSKQCKRDRENFQKSLSMSKKLQAINDKRLKKAGYSNLPEYQQYLIHQQGASGLKTIIASSKGNKLLSRNLRKNMAGNSPYSYRTLRKMGSKLAAKTFLQHWEIKWQKEKVIIGDIQGKTEVIVAMQSTNIKAKSELSIPSVKQEVTKKSVTKEDSTIIVPLFNDYELQIALNIKI